MEEIQIWFALTPPQRTQYGRQLHQHDMWRSWDEAWHHALFSLVNHLFFRRSIWLSNLALGYGIWTQFWPGVGIWRSESSKVQTRGRLPRKEMLKLQINRSIQLSWILLKWRMCNACLRTIRLIVFRNGEPWTMYRNQPNKRTNKHEIKSGIWLVRSRDHSSVTTKTLKFSFFCYILVSETGGLLCSL